MDRVMTVSPGPRRSTAFTYRNIVPHAASPWAEVNPVRSGLPRTRQARLAGQRGSSIYDNVLYLLPVLSTRLGL